MSWPSSYLSSVRASATFLFHLISSATASSVRAISTPTTMIPTSPTNSRQPCSGLGKWKCTLVIPAAARQNWHWRRRRRIQRRADRQRDVVPLPRQVRALAKGLEVGMHPVACSQPEQLAIQHPHVVIDMLASCSAARIMTGHRKTRRRRRTSVRAALTIA